MGLTGCSNSLIVIPGTGYNTVDVPGPNSRGYGNNTDKLLYEIWQTLLLILAGQTPPGMVIPIVFTIGDGLSGTPANGTTSLHAPALQGQNLANKTLLVIRNGILLNYSNGTDTNEIARFNDGTDGGFDFTVASGLSFQTGEKYNIFVIGENTTIE